MKNFGRKNGEIKRRQRESAILRGLAPVLQRVFNENQATASFFVSKIELSSDGGLCYIYVANSDGNADSIKAGIKEIKLFAPSTRAALAKILDGRYVPEVLFTFDKQIDKQRELNIVLSKISDEIRKENAVASQDEEEL